MLNEAITRMSERNAELQPHHKDDYEVDGIWYCHKCNKPRQRKITIGDTKQTVTCNCDCMNEERDKAERERRIKKITSEIDELRSAAFTSTVMRDFTFKSDDRQNAKISDAMRKYAADFDKYYKRRVGLLLYGTVGTGKSCYAACIANAVLDLNLRRAYAENMPKYTAHMTNFSRILNHMQGKLDGRSEYIDALCGYSLLAIDDLGADRDSSFARETVYSVINERYNSKKPLIVTTNLSLDELLNCADTEQRRIYDRVLGMCAPVEFKGESRRRVALKDRFTEMKSELGL